MSSRGFSWNVFITWHDYTNHAGAGTDADIFFKLWNSTSSSWSPTEVVSTESAADSKNPALSTDSTGNVYLAWHDYTNYAGAGTDTDIFYNRWNVSNFSWATTEVLSIESTSNSLDPCLAVDSAGYIHVAWEDTTDYLGAGSEYDVFYKRWNISSSLWTTTEVVSTESTGNSNSPSLAVDSGGYVHATWHDSTDYAGAGTDADIFYKQWNSSTSLWTTTEVVSTESTIGSFCPCLAVDTLGYVHIVWHDYTDYASSGTDTDIFYKLFTGLPATPVLANIDPNPTDHGTISLDWNSVIEATSYYVYRSNNSISSVDGLIPITTVSLSEYSEDLPSEGIYYYVVVVNNNAGNSSLSNCQSVEYKLPVITKTTINSGLILVAFALVFVVTRIRKKNFKLN